MTNASQTFAFDLDRDVRTVEAMAARLKPYVYEDELYGMMPGNLPKLTLGGLLMRLNRLTAIRDLLSPAQSQSVDKARQQLDEIRKEWRVAYEGKIQREFQSRLTSVGQFLEECADSTRRSDDNYPSAMEKRVMAEVLKDEAVTLNIFDSDMETRLTGIDNGIHRYIHPSKFRWDLRLEPAYPRDKYWFLYSEIIPTAH